MKSFRPSTGFDRSMAHFSGIGSVVSGIDPVIQPQAGDASEIQGVMHRQGQVVDKGCQCVHQFRRCVGNFLRPKRTGHLAELLGTHRIKTNDLNLSQKVGDQSQEPVHLGVLVRSGKEFSQGDGGNVRPRRRQRD